MKLINIGFGNMVASSRLIAIVSPESAPVKRTVQEARDRGMVVDGTYGRRTRAVLIMDSDHVVLSALQPETVAARFAGETEEGEPEDAYGIFVCILRTVRCRQGHSAVQAAERG